MFILMFMKYKKILGVNSFFIVMLNTVMLNEFGKYFRIKNINKEFISNYFHHFYSGVNFQKWSMTHPHLKIKDSWSSYKFYVKDLIYEFTQDGIYREQKVKWGSLYKLFIAKNTPVGLTTNFEYLNAIDKDYFYNPNNSFKNGYKQ